MKHIICFSGGHSSALAAIEVVRKFGKANVILLNHECKSEPDDVSRFENEIANYLEMPITYASFEGYKDKDQFDVVIEKGSFINVHGNTRGQALCTYVMKTEPFMKYLNENFSDFECICYYGFDLKEKERITRRSSIMGALGYITAYPLTWTIRSILSTREIGIEPPNTYEVFKHANCIGCLKSGWQHWYCVYVLYPEYFNKGLLAEEKIGYHMHKEGFLKDKIKLFDAMVNKGVVPTEHINAKRFWNLASKITGMKLHELEKDNKPCECIL